jgi:hypothetical protein
MTRRSVVALAALLQTLGCSAKESRGQYASQDCTGTNCTAAAAVAGGGGGAGGTRGTARADSGTSVAPDAAATGFSQCTPDPTTHLTLCLASAACPGVEVNPANFPNCGYVSGAPALTVACLCNGNQLCPVGVGMTCLGLTTHLAPPSTVADICLQLSTGNCTNLGVVTGAGTGGGAAGG